MPIRGSLTLADVAARTDVLAVACSRCDRAGRYPVAKLIDQRGRDFSIPELLRALSQDCPKRGSVNQYDMCGVRQRGAWIGGVAVTTRSQNWG
jgi:hypothetical protein